jgi:hypothetical protein
VKFRLSYLFPLLFGAFLAVSAVRLAIFAVSFPNGRSHGGKDAPPSTAPKTGFSGIARGATPVQTGPSSPLPGPEFPPTPERDASRLLGRTAHLAARAKAKLEEFASKSPPFRDGLAHFDARWTYWISGLVRSRQVALADNGWLFYLTRQDGDSIEDYSGESRYPPYETALLQERLLELENYLAARGIAFAFVVVPNKENVYPEYVPARFRRVSPVSRADALLAELGKNPLLPVADPKPLLLAHKPVRLVYYEYDSHWNRAGAYIGAQAALAALGRPSVPLHDRTVLPAPAPDFAADVPGLLGIPSITARTSTEFTVEGVPILRPDRPGWRELGTVENPSSRTPDTLLILGDSFKNEFAPPFLEEFRRVSDVHWDHCPDFPALLDELRPDAVVLEFVERYLPYAAKTIARLLPG